MLNRDNFNELLNRMYSQLINFDNMENLEKIIEKEDSVKDDKKTLISDGSNIQQGVERIINNRNYDNYCNYYYGKIKEKYPDLTEKQLNDLIQSLIDFYSSIPIIQDVGIRDIDRVLEKGFYNSSNLDTRDFNFGNSAWRLKFSAGLGEIFYFSPSERVSLILSDEVCDSVNNFSFIEPSFFLKDDYFYYGFYDETYRKIQRRRENHFDKSLLPLDKIWEILALNALANYSSVSKDHPFPNGIEPDFEHSLSGRPNIFFTHTISRDKILGFIVCGEKSEELKRILISKGIDEKIIFVEKEKIEGIDIFMKYKTKLLRMKNDKNEELKIKI